MGALSDVFNNIGLSLPQLYKLVFACFWLAGLISVVWGVMNFRHATDSHGRHGTNPVMQSAVSILLGAVLCYLPTMAESVATTIFGAGGSPVGLMDYENPTATGGNTLVSVRAFLQFVGVYFFGQGWLMLRHVGVNGESQNSTFKSGAIKIGAGICLIHLIDTLKLISALVGVPILPELLNGLSG